MQIKDKRTGRTLEIGECFHIGFGGDVRPVSRILSKCTDTDRPWFGQYLVQYTNGDECYASGQELFIKFDDVMDSFFGRKKSS